MSSKKIIVSLFPGPIHFFFGVLTAMVGHTIHGSMGWALVDFIFWPLAIAKWLFFHELTKSVVERTFAFLSQ